MVSLPCACGPASGTFCPRPVEKFADPRLVAPHQVTGRVNRDCFLHEHGDTVAEGEQRREVVGHHHDGDAQALVQLEDQRIDAAGDQGIESGCRLIEKKNAWVEGQRSRQRGPFDHAARQLGGKLDPGIGGQTGERELHRGDHLLLLRRQIGMLAHGNHDVLGHREGGEQRALLKQHADQRGLFRRTDRPDRLVAQKNVPGVRPAQAGERLEQNRFPRTRRAYDADDFARKDIEVNFVVHDLLAKAVDDATRRKYRLPGRLLSAHMPSCSNKIENNASSTMTRKIALTTARVVSWPTLSAEPVTLSPCMQPMTPMKKAKIGALKRPTKRSQPSTAFWTRSRYCSGDTSRSDREIIAPPSKPIMSEKNASSGRAITRAINRGTT